MRQRSDQRSRGDIVVHDFDKRILRTKAVLRDDPKVSGADEKLILDYDGFMVRESLSKATREKHLDVLLSMTRMKTNEWSKMTGTDVEELITKIIETYSDESGLESNTTRDYKKVLTSW